MKREDSEALKAMSKVQTKEYIRDYLSLPFFVMNDEPGLNELRASDIADIRKKNSQALELFWISVDEDNDPQAHIDNIRYTDERTGHGVASRGKPKQRPVQVGGKHGPPPNRNKRTYKKPWVRGDLPRIIYMNRLPGERTTNEEHHDQGPLKHGHPRRGHWRNLRAERFHNHPHG